MIKTLISRLFGTKKAVTANGSHHHQNLNLEIAFISGGVFFFKYRDDFAIPAERALSAMDYYEELNQRIDREYLESFFETIEHLLNRGKLVDASNIIKMAKSRLDHVSNAAILMKLATVIYIAEWENPERFSMVDAEKKIRHWQENEDVESFFLRVPIRQLMPFSESYTANIPNYLAQQSKENERQLTLLLSCLSDEDETSDLKSSLSSQLAKARQLTTFLSQESKITL